MGLPASYEADLIRRGLIAPREGNPVLPLEPGLDEETFQSRVIELAKRHRWRHFHVRNSRRSVAGFPDLVLLRSGALVVAELKVPPNKPSKAQDEWLADFRLVPNCRTYCWIPADWEEIKEVLK